MKCNPRQLIGLCCLLNLLVAFFSAPVSANEKPPRILILPLTIHSEKDLTFLNPGIMDMMASRIGLSARVIRGSAMEPGADPVQRGRDLEADYVVVGSLTLFGESASTDAMLTAIDSGETVLHFSQFGQSSGDVLMHVNQFANQVGHYIDSQSAEPSRSAAPTATAPVMVPFPIVPALEQPIQPAVQAPPTAAGPQPSGKPIETEPAAAAIQPVDAPWTSKRYKGTISALTTADVNGNGSMEIIFAHDDRIVVEHRVGGHLQRIATFDAGRRHTIVAVDAGDFNGNAAAEIFVTRLDAHRQLDSLVLEWNGSGLQSIVSDQRWYFAVSDDPEVGRILVGQRQGTPSAIDAGGLYATPHFLPGVFQLSWTGGTLQAGRRLPLPAAVNLYGFARGDLFHDGAI
ncbi:MAG: FG-GAP-like repeat-containing protein, partial [Desulfosarcina sp.]